MNVTWIWIVIGAVGAILQILIISALIPHQFRKFPALSLYSIASFLATVMEGAAFIRLFDWNTFGKNVYWINELVIQVLVFALVVSLISKALDMGESSPKRRPSLAAGALVIMTFCVILAIIDRGSMVFRQIMTPVSRNLSFASAILNLLLWTLLLSRRDRDKQLMLLSVGIGIQTTGQAIGHSLRIIGHSKNAHPLVETGTILMLLTYVLSLLVLWRALKKNWAREQLQPKPVHAGSFDPPNPEE
jgi:hypothetical protein